MDDIFEYKVGRIKYIQQELTWGQDKKLIAMYQKMATPELKAEEFRMRDIPRILAKYNLVEKFMGIILSPVWTIRYLLSFKWVRYYLFKEIGIDSAANSVNRKIFEDFFLLNKDLVTKLTEFENVLALIAEKATEMEDLKTKKSQKHTTSRKTTSPENHSTVGSTVN